MSWLEKLPLIPLAFAAVVLGLAPFAPEPHLVEKLRMLSSGSLSRPMDILDLVMHGSPAVLLMIKLIHRRRQKA